MPPESMTAFVEQWSAGGIPVLLALSAGLIALRRRLPVFLTLSGFALSISAAVSLAFVRLEVFRSNPMQEIAHLCGILCLLWTAVHAVLLFASTRSTSRLSFWSTLGTLTRVLALLLGVVTLSIQAVVLTMRAVLITLDLLQGAEEFASRDYGFGPAGLWSLGCLLLASLIAGLATRDRRLGVCIFLNVVMLTSWACLLLPPLTPAAREGFERTEMTLLLTGALSASLMMTALATGWLDRRQRRRLARLDPDQLAAFDDRWPGLASGALMVSLLVVTLVCYHLAVPLRLGSIGFRLSALTTSVSAGVAAGACFLMVSSCWHTALAESAMGLTSLAFCGLVICWVPSEPNRLTERYPMVFNAVLVGCASAAAMWAWLACIWRQQLDQDRAWTAAGRLIPVAKRFSFFTATFALLVALIMAVWPRWPTISATDDTLGRMAAGLGGNFFLLLVTLWCSRRLQKFTFQLLTIMVVISTMGFLVGRMSLFASRVG